MDRIIQDRSHRVAGPENRPLRQALLWVLAVSLLILAGCGASVRYSAKQAARMTKPVVAVESFENRCRVPVSWQIGDGLAEELVERLRQTRRYEIANRSGYGITSPPTRGYSPRAAMPPRQTFSIKPEYIIRGRITDFGTASAPGGLLDRIDESLFGEDLDYVVSVQFHITDTAVDRIIASFTASGTVRVSAKKADVRYDTIAFGGFTFYDTPLGRATDRMLDDALEQIVAAIREKPFQAAVVNVINNQVVINAGRQRLVRKGMEFVIRPEPQVMVDPTTNEALGRYSAAPIGRIRIIMVNEKTAVGEIIEPGPFRSGQLAVEIGPREPTPTDTLFLD